MNQICNTFIISKYIFNSKVSNILSNKEYHYYFYKPCEHESCVYLICSLYQMILDRHHMNVEKFPGNEYFPRVCACCRGLVRIYHTENICAQLCHPPTLL